MSAPVFFLSIMLSVIGAWYAGREYERLTRCINPDHDEKVQ